MLYANSSETMLNDPFFTITPKDDSFHIQVHDLYGEKKDPTTGKNLSLRVSIKTAQMQMEVFK